MPFGMMNAPAYFDMFIAHIFSDSQDELISHVDDICVFDSNSASFRAHALHTLSKIEDSPCRSKLRKSKLEQLKPSFVAVCFAREVSSHPKSVWRWCLKLQRLKPPRHSSTISGLAWQVGIDILHQRAILFVCAKPVQAGNRSRHKPREFARIWNSFK